MDETVMANAIKLTEYLFFMIVSSIDGLRAARCEFRMPGIQVNAGARSCFHLVSDVVMACLLVLRLPVRISNSEPE
jgi:hypothetical protein